MRSPAIHRKYEFIRLLNKCRIYDRGFKLLRREASPPNGLLKASLFLIGLFPGTLFAPSPGLIGLMGLTLDFAATGEISVPGREGCRIVGTATGVDTGERARD